MLLGANCLHVCFVVYDVCDNLVKVVSIEGALRFWLAWKSQIDLAGKEHLPSHENGASGGMLAASVGASYRRRAAGVGRAAKNIQYVTLSEENSSIERASSRQPIAWSHLGGLKPQDLETTKPASQLDPFNYSLEDDARQKDKAIKGKEECKIGRGDKDSATKERCDVAS